MPSIQLLSDIHLEHMADQGEAYLDALDPEGVDILVLAGDICSHSLLPGSLRAFARAYPQVLYVLGNHEFYGSSFGAVRALCEGLPPNVHVLENGERTLDGVHFVGSTLWFPDLPENETYAHRLSDFKYIADFRSHVYEENERSIRYLQERVRSDSVVITHHLPTRLAIPERFEDSPLTRFFLCDMASYALHPRLWLFGHTHWHVDRTDGHGTRFLANPLGYPGQQDSGHIPKLVLAID
jgi:hypothetical protein